MKFFYNYVLESLIDKSFYKGYTKDLQERLIKHNKGEVESTRNKRPWKLIYYEACLNDKDAVNREKNLKMANGRRYIKKRLNYYFTASKE